MAVFTPALIVVDMQNDFCPPDGSLAVQGGRDIIPLINQFLRSPAFTYKIATKDSHPQDHISFVTNHPPPNNKPFESYVDIQNHVGGRPEQTSQQRLWPVHCVQGTQGAELVDGLDLEKVDLTVLKGMDPQVETYSVFSDVFGNTPAAGSKGFSHDIAGVLHEKHITHVYVVGLAGNYCVKETAIGAAKAGFISYLVEDAQRGTNPETWPDVKKELAAASVKVITLDSDEVRQLGNFG